MVNNLKLYTDKWEMCGYCEYGYRLFIYNNTVKRLPLPLTEIY